MHKFAAIAAGLTLIAELAVAQPLPEQEETNLPDSGSPPGRGLALVEATEDALLRDLLRQVLNANPNLEVAKAQSLLSQERALTTGFIADPTFSWALFVASPETRTGPQRGSVSVMQKLPQRGIRSLERAVADARSLASQHSQESVALQLVTRARELYYQLLLVDRQRQILSEKREHLNQHEEVARSRYATGFGQGQDVIKLQAEISRVEAEALLLDAQVASLINRLNQLRRQPGGMEVARSAISERHSSELDLDPEQTELWLQVARSCRPELQMAAARVLAATADVALIEKQERAELSLGLGYTVVGKRDDPLGRANSPGGDGDDIVALQGSLKLPVRKQQTAARITASEQQRSVAEAQEQVLETAIRAEVEDLLARIPLAWRRLRVAEDLLLVQSQESLESARSSYIAGRSTALDLLDAEHVLFEAHSAVARARVDHEINLARLEGALGKPLGGSDASDRATVQECRQ